MQVSKAAFVFTVGLIGTVIVAGSAGALPFEIASSAVDADQGNYRGQTFTINNDPVVNGTNDCAAGNCFLLEWTWQINDPNTASGTSAGPLFIDIYDLDAGNAYLGSSSNGIDIQSTGISGDILTWTFDSIAVDPSHLLIAEISTDDGVGNSAVIRLDVALANVSGNLTTTNAVPVSTGFDSIYSATLVPEPATLTLLGLGLASLSLLRKRI